MIHNFSKLFAAFYPPDIPRHERDIDFAFPGAWRPLKCVKCGIKLARASHRWHGNPYCGPCFPGIVPFNFLAGKIPFLARLPK